MNHSSYKIKDFAKVKGGKRLPAGYFVQDGKTEYPYIRVTDMKPDKLDTANIKYLPDGAYEKIKRYTISDNDVYISIAGTIGLTGKIPAYLSGANLTENAAKITDLNKDLIDRDYLIYFLRSKQGQFQIQSRVGGSTQPKLALNRIETIELPVRPIKEQAHVGSILSTYNDLIENNEKRIGALEEMAQLLYNEWFVKFKFLGHEKTKMVDSGTEYGMIPEGWEIKKFGEIIELAYGKALKGENRTEGNVLVYGSSGLVGTHNERLVNGPGIVVGRKGNAGAVHWVDDDFYPIDTTYYVKSSLDLHFIYYLLKNHGFVMGDVAVPGLNRSQTYLNAVLLPPALLITGFSARVSHIFNLVSSLSKKNLRLGKMRDLLIPQLVTGKRELK